MNGDARERQAKQRLELTAAVVRAARNMRDVSQNIAHEDDDASTAWERLDEAMRALDDFAVETAEGPQARHGQTSRTVQGPYQHAGPTTGPVVTECDKLLPTNHPDHFHPNRFTVRR